MYYTIAFLEIILSFLGATRKAADEKREKEGEIALKPYYNFSRDREGEFRREIYRKLSGHYPGFLVKLPTA